jgi:lipoprotein-anchoring transpeptidase ErfK/SrfK
VGQPISAGCIRAKNDNITWLADEVPLGTPIFIEA